MIIHIFFNEFSGLTGGPSGLVGINKLSILGVELDNENKFYIFLATVLYSSHLLWNFLTNRIFHISLNLSRNLNPHQNLWDRCK